jgi:hypothetical protein
MAPDSVSDRATALARLRAQRAEMEAMLAVPPGYVSRFADRRPVRWGGRTYIRLLPDRRDFYVYYADEVEDLDGVPESGCLTADDLPAAVTEDRLREYQSLEEIAEGRQQDFDERRSFLDSVVDPDDCAPGLSAAEYRRLEARRDALLAEEAEVYSHYGALAAQAKAAYEAAKAALVLDLFGPSSDSC